MCVIIIADEGKRPSTEMVKQAWKKNDHGGGIAWRQTSPITGKKEVVWKKGLSLEEMEKMCAELPLPYIAHFRLVSSGSLCDELCHPFEITKENLNRSEGTTEDYVLFHNGTWGFNWSEKVLDIALRPDNPYGLPKGEWSDTRAMSYMIAWSKGNQENGHHFMDFIGQKGVAFGPTDYDVFSGKDGWSEVGPDKIWCSNDYFWPKPFEYKVCRSQGCYIRVGLIEGYCLPCREDQKQKAAKTEEKKEKPHLTGMEFCSECERIAEKSSGENHKVTCSKATNKGALICASCKVNLGINDHAKDCPLEVAEPRGAQQTDPFRIVVAAENLLQKGKISKQACKRVWKRVLGSDRNPSVLESWRKKGELKDPRIEVVTTH